ncbi:hypothetical protein L6452_26603 [Arctium lappa]|uniref:Uncharacterized protein n=1 Tax=Arctium lappa TaxID=4217 RepID=A0ACB8ZU31_ARCLA|nr:hypothetical protein L6452_26603 [Arctium lappa]
MSPSPVPTPLNHCYKSPSLFFEPSSPVTILPLEPSPPTPIIVAFRTPSSSSVKSQQSSDRAPLATSVKPSASPPFAITDEYHMQIPSSSWSSSYVFFNLVK